MKKTHLILLGILLLAFLVRIPGIHQSIFGDEWRIQYAIKTANPAGLSEDFEMPPMSIWVYNLSTQIFGFSTSSFRFASVILGLASILLVYLMGKEVYGEAAGLIAASLMAFSAYHVFASLILEFNSTFLTFGFLFTLLFYIKYIKEQKNIYLALTGVGFAISILSRYEAVLLIPLLFIDSWFEKDLKTAIKVVFATGIIGLIIYSIFPLLSFITNSNQFITTIIRGSNMTSTLREVNIFAMLIQYLYSALWLLPFLVFAIIGLKQPRKHTKWLVWISLIFAFYTFIVQDNTKPLDRYFGILTPALALIGADVIASVKWKKIDAFIIAVFGIISTAIFYFLNSIGSSIPFSDKSAFITNALSLSWNFLIPFNGGSGPVGFYISFAMIASAVIISSFSIITAFFSRKHFKKAIALLIITFIGFNIIMINEFVGFHQHADVDKVEKDAVSYILQHSELKQPIYIFRNWGLRTYLEDRYSQFVSLDFFHDNEKDASAFKEQFEQGGTILYVDFPVLGNGPLKQAIYACKEIHELKDNNIKLGAILAC